MSPQIKLLLALVLVVEDAMAREERKDAAAVLPSTTEYRKVHTSHQHKKEHMLQLPKATNPPTLLLLLTLPLSPSNSRTRQWS
jgi:hypothetical protein